jgi:hypothetical protein
MSVGCRIVTQNGGSDEGVQFHGGPLHLVLPFAEGESVLVGFMDGFGGGYLYNISLRGTPVYYYGGPWLCAALVTEPLPAAQSGGRPANDR